MIGLARSSYDYQPATESDQNLILMRVIDKQYLKYPFYGYPRMTIRLRQLGYQVNRQRVYRLMRLMGLQAVGPISCHYEQVGRLRRF